MSIYSFSLFNKISTRPVRTRWSQRPCPCSDCEARLSWAALPTVTLPVIRGHSVDRLSTQLQPKTIRQPRMTPADRMVRAADMTEGNMECDGMKKREENWDKEEESHSELLFKTKRDVVADLKTNSWLNLFLHKLFTLSSQQRDVIRAIKKWCRSSPVKNSCMAFHLTLFPLPQLPSFIRLLPSRLLPVQWAFSTVYSPSQIQDAELCLASLMQRVILTIWDKELTVRKLLLVVLHPARPVGGHVSPHCRSSSSLQRLCLSEKPSAFSSHRE